MKRYIFLFSRLERNSHEQWEVTALRIIKLFSSFFTVNFAVYCSIIR